MNKEISIDKIDQRDITIEIYISIRSFAVTPKSDNSAKSDNSVIVEDGFIFDDEHSIDN